MSVTPNDTFSGTWTAGWSTFEPFQLGGQQHYLGYKAATGQITIDRVRADGSGVDTVFGDTWSLGWTSFVPFVLNGAACSLEYKIETGQVSIERFKPDGQGVDTLYGATWSLGWTSFMPFTLGDQPHYLGYKLATGEVTIDRIKPDGSGVDTLYSATWSLGWTSFIPFTLNGQPHYLAYKKDSGEISIDRIKADGSGVDTITPGAAGTWTNGWTSFVPFSIAADNYYLGHKAESGQVTIDKIRPDATGVDTVLSATWSADWTSLVPLVLGGVPSYLVYKISNGDVAIGNFRAAPSDKVTSSNIQVGGKPFADWFNADFKPTQPGAHPTIIMHGKPAQKFPGTVDKTNFATIFDRCEGLWAKEITIHQFLTFFCIMYNETGGKFLPISEFGGDKYFFESGNKQSYNAPPNRPAGTQMAGILTPDDVTAWNSTTTYPAPTDPTILAASRECDFYKYRGRGLIQVTWRDNYIRIVDPLLLANGYNKSDDLAEAELGRIILTDSRIYVPMVRSFFRAIATAFAKVDDTPPNWVPTGTAISGTSSYGQLLQWRCETLLAAMTAAGFTCA